MPFMLLLPNHTYCITDICAEEIGRFENMGLTVNTIIKVKHILWLGGPIVIEIHGRLIALRKREIECLKLQ